eukprot:6839132-Pyramimonas_sp.AAC.1
MRGESRVRARRRKGAARDRGGPPRPAGLADAKKRTLLGTKKELGLFGGAVPGRLHARPGGRIQRAD